MSAANIVVTGFGPFGEYKVNTSELCLNYIKELWDQENNGFNLITSVLPVRYDIAQEEVSSIWKQYQPRIVIHTGVSKEANSITIEKSAPNGPYTIADINGKWPDNCCCKDENIFVIKNSTLDIDKICTIVNETQNPICKLKASSSNDPGKFLCAFTYFCSLCIDPSRTVFIHIPPFGVLYSIEEISHSLYFTIKCIIENIKN